MVKRNGEKIWITWEKQRRSIELAKAFNAKLFIIDKLTKSRIFRYIYCSFYTLLLLKREAPAYVFGQNPSIMLALLLCLVKWIFGYKLIIDRHSNFRYGKPKGIITYIFNIISNYTIQKSDITIVTNKYLKAYVDNLGGFGLVLEDKLPDMSLGELIRLGGKTNVVYVSSFSSDEPTDMVLEAFGGIDNKIHLYVTGNYKGNDKFADKSKYEKENIHFTGFLDEKQFQSLLLSADILIVLTKNDNTLTCGAYEGVTLAKPMILSNTNAIKDYFAKGVVYCDPNVESIITCLYEVIENYGNLKMEIERFKSETSSIWSNKFQQICRDIFGHKQC